MTAGAGGSPIRRRDAEADVAASGTGAGVAASGTGAGVAASGTSPCPNCGEATIEGANWCEACGHDLSQEPLPTCVACGEPQVGTDGYCQVCGHRQPVGRDHVLETLGPLAAVSDRGRRRHRNEDAFALGHRTDDHREFAVMVVCDGVSTTSDSARASQLAADVTRDHLLAAIDGQVADQAIDRFDGRPAGGSNEVDGAGAGSAPADDPIMAALGDAVAAAQAAATGDGPSGSLVEPGRPSADRPDSGPVSAANGAGSPSTTLVVVVALISRTGGSADVWVAWVGDSRAYLVARDSTEALTADHQLAGALTRWLGADSENPYPDVRHHRVTTPAWLLVCSDGLWRYFHAPSGEPAHDVIGRVGDGAGSEQSRELHTVEELIRFANDRGGHDNITVALLDLNRASITSPEEERNG